MKWKEHLQKKRLLKYGVTGATAAGYYLWQKQAKPFSRLFSPRVPETNRLILFQLPYSPYCIKVQYCLRYKGIPFETVNITPILHEGFSRQISGQIKVPYIQYGGQVIVDSTTIAHYLDTLVSEPPLLPKDPTQREEVLLLEDWLDEVFMPALARLTYVKNARDPGALIDNPEITTGMAFLDAHKDKIVPLMLKRSLKKQGLSLEDEAALRPQAEHVLERMRYRLKHQPYLVGDELTLADLTLAGHLNTLEKLPNLASRYSELFAWRASLPVTL